MIQPIGYLKLWREIASKPIWLNSTPEQKTILITLLMMVNFKPKQWEWKGDKFEVGKGQVITSIDSIVKNCGKGVTTQNVRTSLKRFEKLEFLTNESTKTGRLITIGNWSVYQPDEENQQSNQQTPNKDLTDSQQRPNKELTPREERKKENKVKKVNKVKYIEFVLLTDEEHLKLVTQYGPSKVDAMIENLNNYIGSKGVKYKSHYHTLLSWERKNNKNNSLTKFNSDNSVETLKENLQTGPLADFMRGDNSDET